MTPTPKPHTMGRVVYLSSLAFAYLIFGTSTFGDLPLENTPFTCRNTYGNARILFKNRVTAATLLINHVTAAID